MLDIGLMVVLAYLLGSVPFGFLVARSKGVDLRHVGSGNIGSTNIYRAFGLRVAVLVFLLDAAKGVAATRLVPLIGSVDVRPENLSFICGLAAMAGSVASVFMRFRGGKGVATGAGVFLGLAPLAAAICIAVWAALVAKYRYVSLGSLVAACVLPVLVAAFDLSGFRTSPVFYLAVIVALIVFIRHRANIGRLVAGKEHRVGGTGGNHGS